jgi:hypothetical protein
MSDFDPFFEEAPPPRDRLWTPPEKRTERRLHMVEVEVARRKCHFKKREGKKRGCARCGKPKGDWDHVGAPPSFNVGGSGFNRFVYQNVKKQWSEKIIAALEFAALPRPLGYVQVEGLLGFPDRTRRDQGNYRVLLEKVVGDALQEGGWLADDSWDFYEFGGLAYRYEKGEMWTKLMVMPEWEKETPDVAGTSAPAGQEALPL